MTSPGGKEVGRISIRVVPDTSRFRSELKAQLEAIEKGLKGKVEIKADLDTGSAMAKYEVFKKALADNKPKIRPDIEIGDALAKWSALKAALSRDAKVKVDVDVDQNRIQRTLSTIGAKLRSAFSDSGGGGFKGGSGIPLGSFADSAALVAAVASIAAPAIALLTGALTTLPAALSAVLVPIGAVALGLDGLKKAAEVLTPDVAALKATMSQRFQDVFTPIFEKAKAVFPALQSALPAVADAMGTVADAFVNTITSASGLERIKSTIGNIAQTISASAPGIASFTDGLLSLADKVSAKFPAVAEWFNKVGDSFSNWVTKITTPDANGVSPLDTAMQNFGSTLKGILDIGGDILKQGFDWLSDPKFGESMKQFVADTKTLVSDVLPGLGGLFEQLSGFLNVAVTALDKINNFKPPEGLHLGGDLGANPGAFPGMKNPNEGKPPGTLDKIESGQFITETTSSFQAMVAMIEGKFVEMWSQIKLGATTAFTEISATATAILGGIWDGLTANAAAAWNGIVATVTNVVTQIASILAQVPGKVASAWASIPSVATQIWSQVVSAVQQAGAQILAAIVQAGAQIVAEVASWGGKVASAAANLAHALDGIGGQMIAGFLAGFRSAAAAAVEEVAGWAAKIAAAARNALGIHSPSKVFTEIGAQTAQGMQDGIDGGFQGVVDRATALAKAITDAVNNGLTGVDLNPLHDQIKQQIDEIGLESDALKVQLDGTTDKGQKDQIRGQRSQLQTLKDQLKQQSDQLGFSQEYGDSIQKNDNMLGDSLSKMIDIGSNFAQANLKQFESDIGMSGNGAIPSLVDQGLGWLTQTLGHLVSGGFGGTTINVGSVDDALRVKQNEQNKQALQYTRR